jgi:hypothetical protein
MSLNSSGFKSKLQGNADSVMGLDFFVFGGMLVPIWLQIIKMLI